MGGPVPRYDAFSDPYNAPPSPKEKPKDDQQEKIDQKAQPVFEALNNANSSFGKILESSKIEKEEASRELAQIKSTKN